MLKEPIVYHNLFNDLDFKILQNYFKNFDLNSINFDGECGRKLIHTNADLFLKEYGLKLQDTARKIFNSQSLLHTYSLFSEYSENTISLDKHKDLNACTYTIDLVLYQTKKWGLWIEGKEYFANENEAICFWGEEQEHWRETIVDNKDVIAVIFFHYAEPDHWYFTKGPNHIHEIYKLLQQQSLNS